MGRKSAGTWTIATLRGVELRMHFSLLFLLFYVVLAASLQFPFVASKAGIEAAALPGSPLFWGFAFALGLLVSVVLHEFAHVLMAQSMGVKVRGITLMMLGGVSEMERIPEKPYAEFRVSVVGPLTSFALAGALLLVRNLAHSNGGMEAVELISYWLSRVNLALGIFNLLPAFPLDGGRAFRSLLAARVGPASATRTAVGVARGLSWFLGTIGFLTFNFLLILIALFIYSAASGELAISVTRGMLKGMPASAALIRAEAIGESERIASAAERMLRTRQRMLPVLTRSGEPALVRLEDIRGVPGPDWPVTTVADVMRPASRFLRPDEPLEEALAELASSEALPVREGNRVIGLVRYRDVIEELEFRTVKDRAA